MTTSMNMREPRVVSREEWLRARTAHLKREKELTRLRDAIAKERRELPWVRVDKAYEFGTPAGRSSLAGLFDGREQLIVYHFMFHPQWEEGCVSCSYVADHFDGMLPHLNARGITLTAVSRAPLARLEAFKHRLAWRFPWASSQGSDFNRDFHVSFTPADIASGEAEYNFERGPVPLEELPGISVFIRRGDEVFHTYSSYARGLDMLVGTYNYLDLTPKGRDEEGLAHTMAWVRHHDRYGPDYRVDPKAGYAEPTRVGGEQCSCCH
jgi:predicted dithiol-disulfide oxidoreductase (DUF899 family)